VSLQELKNGMMKPIAAASLHAFQLHIKMMRKGDMVTEEK
jgi:hypothetical protein